MIRIFNPHEKPFGPLSNNFNFPFELDGRSWKTPTNYIYANMFWEYGRKNLIGNSKVRDVYNIFINEITSQREVTIRKALKNAFTVLFNTNEDAKNALLATEDKKLILEGNGSMLGLGPRGDGMNIYGIQLEEFRTHLAYKEKTKLEQKEIEEFEDKIYTIYRVYETLNNHMKEGNDIDEYIDKDYDTIVNTLDEPKLLKKIDFIRLYNQDNITLPTYVTKQFNNDDGLLVAAIRADKLVDLQSKRKFQRRDGIFKIYLRDLISTNYENLSEEEQDVAISQSIPGKNYSEIKNKIVNLYELGILNENVSEDIDAFLDSIPEITQEDITQAKSILTNSQILDDIKSISSIASSSSKSSNPSSSSKSSNAPSISSAGSEVYVKSPQEINYVSYSDWVLKSNDRARAHKEGTFVESDENQIPSTARPRLPVNDPSSPPALLQPKPEKMQSFNPSKSNTKHVDIYKIKPTDILSPRVYTNMLSIKANDYPTIYHYVNACLIADLYNTDTDNEQIGPELAHRYIMTRPESPKNPGSYVYLDELPRLFKKYYDIGFEARMKRNAVRSINKRFSHRMFQDLLLSTNDNQIEYGDTKNIVLGTGRHNDGQNFVGNHLMYIRQNLREERKNIPEEISIANIAQIITSDKFLNNWVISRTNDMIKSIIIMNMYLCEKQNKCSDKITKNNVKEILSYIYHPCSHITKLSTNVKTPIPNFYIDMVRKSTDKLDLEGIKVLWDYIVTILYFIITSSPNMSDISKTISKAQEITSNTTKSVNESILGAIIKILLRVRQYNQDNNLNQQFTREDILLAVRLILGKSNVNDIEEVGSDFEKLVFALDNYDVTFDDNPDLLLLVNGAISYISNYNSPEKIKINRVNFYNNV